MSEINLNMVLGRLVDPAHSLMILDGFSNYGDCPYQSFGIVFEPELRPDQVTMRRCDGPFYDPSDPSRGCDPEALTLIQSTKARYLAEFEFGFGQWRDDLLPLRLRLRDGCEKAIEALGLVAAVPSRRDALAELIGQTFRLYRPAVGLRPRYDLLLVARPEDALSLWNRAEPRFDDGDTKGVALMRRTVVT